MCHKAVSLSGEANRLCLSNRWSQAGEVASNTLKTIRDNNANYYYYSCVCQMLSDIELHHTFDEFDLWKQTY